MITTETLTCAAITGGLSTGVCYLLNAAGYTMNAHVRTFVCASTGTIIYKVFYKE